MSREGKRSIHKNRRYNGVPLGMADKTAQFERRAFLAAALGAGLALTAGIGSADGREENREAAYDHAFEDASAVAQRAS